MPEQKSQTEAQFIEEFLNHYDNPRKLPVNWVRAYLKREKPELAIDVMRAYDLVHEKLRLARWQVVILCLLVLKEFIPVIAGFLGR